MDISFSISSAPSVTDNIAVVAYRADTNGAPQGGIVAQVVFNPPHNNSRAITFTGLNPIPYVINIYETVGAFNPSTPGQLRFSWIYRPEFTDYNVKVQFLNMVEGDRSYNVPDNSWNGFTAVTIDRRGIGNLKPIRAGETQDDTDEIFIRDGLDDDPKGFDLLKDGDQFSDGELFVVTLFSSLTSRLPILNVAKVIYDERIITNDASVSQTDSNKAIRLQGADGVAAFTVQLPDISTLTPFACYLPFVSDGGGHVNASIQAYGTNRIYIYNPYAATPQTRQYRSVVHLGQSEQFFIVNNATGWVVAYNNTAILTVGTERDTRNRAMANMLFADGSVVLRTTYRRLWEWVLNIELGGLVSYSTWNAADGSGKGFYHTGDGSTTFGIPQLYSVGFARPASGNTGMYTKDAPGDHFHAIATANETGADVPFETYAQNDTTKSILVRVNSKGGNPNYDLRARRKVSGTSKVLPDLGQTSSPWNLRNGVYVNEYFDSAGNAKAGTPTETTPKSYNVYRTILI